MRIRFLSAFEPGWAFYRDLLPALVEKRGWKVELLLSGAEYRGGREPIEEYLKGRQVRVKRLAVGGRKNSKRPGKLRTFIVYSLKSAWHTLFAQGADLNLFITQPPLFHLWGWVLSSFRGQAYGVINMDSYPDVAIKAGMLSSKSLITRLLSALARFSLRRADCVIAIGRCMQEDLIARGVRERRVFIAHNWVADASIRPIPRYENLLRKELGLKEETVVLYSGNMGIAHDFSDILPVIGRLKDLKDLVFVFIGGGPRFAHVESALEERRLHNAIMLPYQPVERLAHSLSLGDIHFVTLREGFEGLVVPSKTYGAFATGRPVLYQGRAEGEIARLIEDEDIGTVVPLGAAQRLEDCIRRYHRSPEVLRRQGQKALQLAQGRLSRECALDCYAEILGQVLEERRRDQ